MTNLSHNGQHHDSRLPPAMWIFAAVVIVTFFGMVVTSSHVLRPILGPTAPTTILRP
jgi:hypothetical protein